MNNENAAAERVRLRNVLREAQSVVCESKCPSTWLSIEGKPVCSDICRKITAALAANGDGGGE